MAEGTEMSGGRTNDIWIGGRRLVNGDRVVSALLRIRVLRYCRSLGQY